MALFGWIEEKHLDVPEEEGSQGFLMYAQQGNRAFPLASWLLTEMDLSSRTVKGHPLQGSEG